MPEREKEFYVPRLKRWAAYIMGASCAGRGGWILVQVLGEVWRELMGLTPTVSRSRWLLCEGDWTAEGRRGS